VVLDIVLEQLGGPHLGVVAEQEEEDTGEADRDLVVALPRVVPGRIGAFHGGVHASHEFRGALALILGLDVERAADLGEHLVGVEDEVVGQVDGVELRGEPGIVGSRPMNVA